MWRINMRRNVPVVKILAGGVVLSILKLFHNINKYCPCMEAIILLKTHDTDTISYVNAS